jgi:hypothetical protein
MAAARRTVHNAAFRVMSYSSSLRENSVRAHIDHPLAAVKRRVASDVCLTAPLDSPELQVDERLPRRAL